MGDSSNVLHGRESSEFGCVFLWILISEYKFWLKRRDDNCAALTLIGISDTPCRNELNLHLRVYM